MGILPFFSLLIMITGSRIAVHHNLTDCVNIKKTMDPHSLEHIPNSLLLVERP